MYGEKHFQPQFPALTTAIFDVSKPLNSQSIAANRYDLAIAANVLHATPNIRETLRNAKAALKNQGVLLLNEISAWSLFNHLTFGLLEGWWLYEDKAVRLPGSPGLAPEKWRGNYLAYDPEATGKDQGAVFLDEKDKSGSKWLLKRVTEEKFELYTIQAASGKVKGWYLDVAEEGEEFKDRKGKANAYRVFLSEKPKKPVKWTFTLISP